LQFSPGIAGKFRTEIYFDRRPTNDFAKCFFDIAIKGIKQTIFGGQVARQNGLRQMFWPEIFTQGRQAG
jgi:hypothetical protein